MRGSRGAASKATCNSCVAIDFRDFPRLQESGFELTSEPTKDYNCIGWAAGDVSSWWWPHEDGWWPAGLPLVAELENFRRAFALIGYEPCVDGSYEPGMEKIALYVDGYGEPSHAARQIGPELWTSKIGENDDISHTLAGMEGSSYGEIVQFLRRRAPGS